jgi:multiple sugar transport system substrate-binding protein
MKRLLQTIMFGAGIAALASVASAETKVQLVEVITSPQRTEFLRKSLEEFEKANPDI